MSVFFGKKSTATEAEAFLQRLEEEAEAKAVNYGTRFESLSIAAEAKAIDSERLAAILKLAPNRANELMKEWRQSPRGYADPRVHRHHAIEIFSSWAMRTGRECPSIVIESLCEVGAPRPNEYCPARSSIDDGVWRWIEASDFELTKIMVAYLERKVRAWAEMTAPDHDRIARCRQLLGLEEQPPIVSGEAWSDAALDYLDSLRPPDRQAWVQFLIACGTTTGSSPSVKAAKNLRELWSEVAKRNAEQVVTSWLTLVERPRTERASGTAISSTPDFWICHGNQEVLRGLCWTLGALGSTSFVRCLGGTALSCFRKIPSVGPRAVKVANAAIWALSQIPGPDALGQLAMLRVKVKFIPAQKAIEKALTAAATREGLPRAEIEELGVPTYGLTSVGLRREEFGDTVAELAATGGDVALRFFKKAVAGEDTKGKREMNGKESRRDSASDGIALKGKEVKSVPASVKKDFADELKELKAAAKDLTSMLSAQRDRIDSMFLDNRSWPLEAWRERYLDHPVVGVIARRLIWTVTSGGTPCSVLHHDGQLVNHRGEPCTLAADSVVRLWHPVEASADEVLAWRRFVEEKQIRQPFKQAHREVYLLTDAERRTNTYSNRFAAHVVRQHQFKALADQRNWRSKLRLMVDAEYPPPSRAIGAHLLRAEFWVEPVGDDYGTDTNESGAYLHLATDQVRFYDVLAAENSVHASGGGYAMGAQAGNAVNDPLPLESIPPIVLSEILRDCDLFVGVASVGNNPQWQDGGPNNQFRDYWQAYSFGDLAATAQTRRDLLSRLVPRLKIADRCSLSDRFLVVRGNIRTYKIHLGSGNILMEPNDQYLCIVPSSNGGVGGAKSSGASGVFLPFEGDRTLSIILSKAFLLAADDAITDTTITRQIVH